MKEDQDGTDDGWEYKVLDLQPLEREYPLDREEYEKKLNQLGAQGWEAAFSVKEGLWVTLKRPRRK